MAQREVVGTFEGRIGRVQLPPSADDALTADPSDEGTWVNPCWSCGNVPGCAWVDGCGYAACPECFAD